jgi:hypothetical protein
MSLSIASCETAGMFLKVLNLEFLVRVIGPVQYYWGV